MLVDMGILTLLVEVGSLTPTLGKVCSAEVSIVVMFVLNDHWTFNESGKENTRELLRRFGWSNVVRWGGAGVALLILHLLTTTLDVWYLLANAIGIGIGVIFNYVFESLITSKTHMKSE